MELELRRSRVGIPEEVWRDAGREGAILSERRVYHVPLSADPSGPEASLEGAVEYVLRWRLL